MKCFLNIYICHSNQTLKYFSDIAGNERPNLPTYTASEVASHDTFDKRIWVCYKSGVYDITDFVAKHPGGDKILMAAGGSLEPFWELFAVHKSPQVWKFINYNALL